MRIEFENGKPVIRMEREDVKVKITFRDTGKENIKEAIIDLLTMAYEKKVITEVLKVN